MKVLFNFASTMMLIATLTISCATTTKEPVASDSELTEQERNAEFNSQISKANAVPEVQDIHGLTIKELNAAIETYGRSAYDKVFPKYNELLMAFNSSPCKETKEALLTYLKEHKLFEVISKPTPKDLQDKALKQGVSIPEYGGVETDYAKIEAFYDMRIKAVEAHKQQAKL